MERLIPACRLKTVPAREIPASRLGIGFEKLDRDVFDPEKAYGPLAAIGVKKVRLQSGWMKTERQEGVYDFAWLDRIVDRLAADGMEPWLCLCYGNPLYTDHARLTFGAVGCPPIADGRQRGAWLRYVDATVRHFRGRIRLYEIWNEPDLGYSWKHRDGETPEETDWQRNAAEYGRFARDTARAIRQADPGSEVAALTLSRTGNLSYANGALAAGLAEEIDYVSFHIYSPDDRVRAAQIEALGRLARGYNPRIRLIQGESGAQSRSDGHGAMRGFAWTPEKQVKWLLRSMITDLETEVAFTSYFSTMDMIEALNGRTGQVASYLDYGYFGVLSASFDEEGRATGEYTPKPAYAALQALAALMRGNARPCCLAYVPERLPSVRVNGMDFTGDSLRVCPFRLEDGSVMLAYWNAVDLLTETYEGTCSLAVYGAPSDRLRLCDLRDGTLYQLPEGMSEDLGHGGVRLKHLPLTDCPLAVLFSGKETEPCA